ncbi:hypothetical protein F4819DRAFT_227079 [Hypoxylon fuscum]|nr:hypothetical protein F4819DRAFT_227079 [Hypoxylon fuscum]
MSNMCLTQWYTKDSVRIGEGEFFVRWTPGSVVKCNIDEKSFEYLAIAELVSAQVFVAISSWKGAGVEFKEVGINENATFQIKYRDLPDDGRTEPLARAFLPQTEPGVLYVYEAALVQPCLQHLDKIISHEIGHILGLRHESGGSKGEERSIQYGVPDSNSVMMYFNTLTPRTVQEREIEEIKDLYALRNNGVVKNIDLKTTGIREMRVRDITPRYSPGLLPILGGL